MSYKDLSKVSCEEQKNFINSFDTVMTDCDGVLWLGGNAIPGSPEVMNGFKKMGKRVFYVTNNSTLTRSQFLEKFTRLGFDVTEENIISTAWLSARYLKNRGFNKKVYIIGTKAIEEELQAVGIESIGVGPDLVNPNKIKPESGVIVESFGKTQSNVGAVIVGYDHYFSVPKMVKAATYLNDPDVLFIGTNTDERYPRQGINMVWPGTGCFIAAIEKCALREPIIMGKPSSYIIDEVLKGSNIDPKRTLMIGDRCNTDIYFGTRANMITLMVLSGVHKVKDLEEFTKKGQTHLLPTYYSSKLGDILSFLN